MNIVGIHKAVLSVNHPDVDFITLYTDLNAMGDTGVIHVSVPKGEGWNFLNMRFRSLPVMILDIHDVLCSDRVTDAFYGER